MTSVLTDTLCSPWGLVLAFLWGAVWGSFHNVVIVWALGQRRSLVTPSSHCLFCGTPIRAWDNIPILSYLLLKGRCRACRRPFSPRYLIVELLGGLLALSLYARFVSGCTGGDLYARLALFVIYEKFAGFLVIVSATDVERLIIPDKLTYPAIPAAMTLSLLLPLPQWWDGLLGVVLGYGTLWLVASLYALIRKREGMGLGDAKLLAVIGAIVGWRLLPAVIFLASLQGSLVGIAAALLGSRFVRSPSALDEQAFQEDLSPGALPHEASRENAPSPTLCSTGQRQYPETPLENATHPTLGVSRTPPENDVILPHASVETAPSPPSFRFAAIPFGPFLALAALEVLFLGPLLGRFLPFFP